LHKFYYYFAYIYLFIFDNIIIYSRSGLELILPEELKENMCNCFLNGELWLVPFALLLFFSFLCFSFLFYSILFFSILFYFAFLSLSYSILSRNGRGGFMEVQQLIHGYDEFNWSILRYYPPSSCVSRLVSRLLSIFSRLSSLVSHLSSLVSSRLLSHLSHSHSHSLTSTLFTIVALTFLVLFFCFSIRMATFDSPAPDTRLLFEKRYKAILSSYCSDLPFVVSFSSSLS
jgi:hypothetical protein